MIRILVPLADGHRLSTRTMASIVAQVAECEVIPISRPMAKNKRNSEAECRNELKKYATGEYVVYMDSDVVFSGPTDISDCMRFLREHPEIDAVALDTKGPHGNAEDTQGWLRARERMKHVVVACMAVRTAKLKTITWRQTRDNQQCLCKEFNQDVSIVYLDGRPLWEDKR